jgi:ribonuclease P protein component
MMRLPQPAPQARMRFPRTARLTRPGEFKRLFAQGQRQTDACFAVLALDTGQSTARLGLVVPRRLQRRAVDRNRIRRVVREHFRFNSQRLPAMDIIVMVREGLKNQSNTALRHSLDRHWQKLIDRCEA